MASSKIEPVPYQTAAVDYSGSDGCQSREFSIFCGQLLKRSHKQWTLFCGSFYELPIYYVLKNPTDIDHMLFRSHVCAIPEGKKAPDCFLGNLLTIESGKHSGFARLKLKNGDAYRHTVDRTVPNHGPAILGKVSSFLDKSETIRKFVAFESDVRDFVGITTTDMVYSVYCPYWPPEAAEWITRKRNSGWPEKDIIEKVITSGCHFVAKWHHSNPNDDTEWRFSFSQAEVDLVHSWNGAQKYIYHILRLVKDEVIKKCDRHDRVTVLCTYYFKNLMFWACEEKTSEFWEESRMETSIDELILTMIEWLIDRNCPNYFILENNMMDHLFDDVDVSKEVDLLLKFRLFDISKLSPACGHSLKLNLTLTTKQRLYVLFTFRTFLSERQLADSNVFCSAMQPLYNGISKHLQLMSVQSSQTDMSVINIGETARLAIEYLQTTSSIYEDKGFYYRMDIPLNESLGSFLTTSPVMQGLMFDEAKIEHKFVCCNSYQRSYDTRKSGCSVCDTVKNFNYLFQVIVSATSDGPLDPTFLLSAAYRANLYYTGMEDYGKALDICTDTLSVLVREVENGLINKSTYNEWLFVILNKKWLPIFDDHIKTVFGFVSLLLHIQDKGKKTRSERRTQFNRSSYFFGAIEPSSRNLLIQIYPIQFLRYIGIQCRRKLQLTDDNEMFSEDKLKKCVSHSFLMAQRRQSIVFLAAAANIRKTP